MPKSLPIFLNYSEEYNFSLSTFRLFSKHTFFIGSPSNILNFPTLSLKPPFPTTGLLVCRVSDLQFK